MITGTQLIENERRRQIEAEGWSSTHDDEHVNGELTEAAMCYEDAAGMQIRGACGWDRQPDNFPWQPEWWKPAPEPERNLVKAGALIAAELDRLQRIKEVENPKKESPFTTTLNSNHEYYINHPEDAPQALLGIELAPEISKAIMSIWREPYITLKSPLPKALTDTNLTAEVLFFFVILRAILLPHPVELRGRTICVYCLTHTIAKETFIPQFDNLFKKHKEFADLFIDNRKSKEDQKLFNQHNSFKYMLHNGNTIEFPSPDFLRDARSQAGKRYNDLCIYQPAEVDEQTRGIKRMLFDRATSETHNRDNPVWQNHVLLIG